MTIIDNAVYVDGVRTAEPQSLEQTFETLNQHGGMAWIGLYRPTEDEMAAVAAEFGLHRLAVEDAISAHQRPKLERYDDNLFTVLRPGAVPGRDGNRRNSASSTCSPARTSSSPSGTPRPAGWPRCGGSWSGRPDLLCHGPEAVLYALMDQVVDDYVPVVAGLENDIDEIEDQLFSGDPKVSRRIYELAREVIQFQRAIHPLPAMMQLLRRGFEKYQVNSELQHNLRDVEDHVERLISRADSFRDLLQNALTLDGTLTANRQNEASAMQNEQVKKISSWAAILFAPSFVAGIYGMNFDVMPELQWSFGYPMAIGLMAGTAALMYGIFKNKGWL